MTDKKRILIVCQYFYPEKISSGILPYEIAVELSKEGYEVNALVGYPKEYYDGKKVQKKELIDNGLIKQLASNAYSPSKFEFSAEWKNYHSKRRDWFTDERIGKNAKSKRKQPQRK